MEVADRERALALGGVKQRSLLALLLLHANEVVAAEQLTAADERGAGRDASRLLADASLIVQRFARVVAEPLLARPGREGLFAPEDPRTLFRWSLTGSGS